MPNAAMALKTTAVLLFSVLIVSTSMAPCQIGFQLATVGLFLPHCVLFIMNQGF